MRGQGQPVCDPAAGSPGLVPRRSGPSAGPTHLVPSISPSGAVVSVWSHSRSVGVIRLTTGAVLSAAHGAFWRALPGGLGALPLSSTGAVGARALLSVRRRLKLLGCAEQNQLPAVNLCDDHHPPLERCPISFGSAPQASQWRDVEACPDGHCGKCECFCFSSQ